jgi:hypothetical protein
VSESNGYTQQEHYRQKVGEAGRILERARTVRVEEPATVGAQLLDGFLGGDRPTRDDLSDAVQGIVDMCRSGKSLNGPLSHEYDREHECERKQDVESPTDKVDPEIPDRLGALPGESPDEGHSDGDADRGAEEVLQGEGPHLREVRHGRLARVVLPVGVGHERDDRVPRQCRGDAR